MPQVKMTKEQAANILRSVSEENAFRFYESIDAPISIAARSLQEFLELLKNVKLASIEFHSARGDFEKWIRMLGDETLANQISSLESKRLPPDELRNRLILVIRLRMQGFERQG
jgi:hypothetical protein